MALIWRGPRLKAEDLSFGFAFGVFGAKFKVLTLLHERNYSSP